MHELGITQNIVAIVSDASKGRSIERLYGEELNIKSMQLEEAA